MNQYFAVTDDRHDTKDPVTVVRVVEGAGPYGITRLTDDAAWVRTTLLDQIEAGEVPYQLRSITRKAAARIRERREKKIAFRYSILVRDDDPTDEPIVILREWDAASGDSSYAETFTRDGDWEHTNLRLDMSGAATLGQGKQSAGRVAVTTRPAHFSAPS